MLSAQNRSIDKTNYHPLYIKRKHRGNKIDIETGDLILEAHRQEHWVVKRNMMGDIIDSYRVEADLDIR